MSTFAGHAQVRLASRLRFPDLPIEGTVGTSFKPCHLADILAAPKQVGFLEVHAENYMGAGGPAHRDLERLRSDYPLSVHGVCMSIGGPEPIDADHLERFRSVVERYEPALVSEHLAWSSHGTTHYNDLLPLPYTKNTLAKVAGHIDQIQTALRRPILLENPSTYLAFRESTLTETDFIREIALRTGCGLLLDINNVFVSAANHGISPLGYLAAFPLDQVGEIHLAGHAAQTDETGGRLLIDSHDRKVCGQVWALYEHVISRAGPIATLVEWDSATPGWPELRAEAQLAQDILNRQPSATQRITMPATDPDPPGACAPPSYAARFAAGLLDPLRPAPAGLTGPQGKPADARYNVYRNNVTVSLIDALASVFSATRRITGEDFFRAMARFYVRSNPPRSRLIFAYGDTFPDFIANYEYAQDMPWLADVARIERAWLDSQHAADATPLSAEALAAVPLDSLENLVFTPHPAARLLKSSFPAFSIFTMNRGDGKVEPIASLEPETTLVTRPAFDVAVRSLPAGSATFLGNLLMGGTFASAAEAGFRAAEDFDLAASITGMIDAGVFTSCTKN
jgi:hypothetical protein